MIRAIIDLSKGSKKSREDSNRSNSRKLSDHEVLAIFNNNVIYPFFEKIISSKNTAEILHMCSYNIGEARIIASKIIKYRPSQYLRVLLSLERHLDSVRCRPSKYPIRHLLRYLLTSSEKISNVL